MIRKQSAYMFWLGTFVSFLPLLQGQNHSETQIPEKPRNFPTSIQVQFSTFENWVGEVKTDSWIAYPENVDQVLQLANWARNASYRLRPSGYRHTWAPVTVGPSEENVVVVDTTKSLTRMGIISEDPENASFWTEPGRTVISILEELEGVNLSLGSFPAVGEISIGGALAVGAHGLGITKAGGSKLKGHTFGSMSNLIIKLTAVVFDPDADAYVLKTFHRSDTETKAFLINFGRTFITNVTLRAGPLIHLRSMSTFRYPAETLFAPSNGANTFADFQREHSRVEVFYVPSLKFVWVLTFSAISTKPLKSRKVSSPYVYGKNLFDFGAINAMDIWGTPKDVLLFVHPEHPKFSDGSWVITTSRDNIQYVAHNVYRIFEGVLAGIDEEIPNLVLEMRTVTTDDPADVGIPGAESPGLGQFHPVEGRPDMDVVVIFEIASNASIVNPERKGMLDFLSVFEKLIADFFNDDRAILRLEWSKGWGFSSNGPYTEKQALRNVKSRGKLGPFTFSVDTLEKYDPWRVFTSPFVDMLLEPPIIVERCFLNVFTRIKLK